MEKVIHYTLEYGIETIPIYVLHKYFQMRNQLFHFTRIPGCNKINQNKKYPPVIKRSGRDLEFYLHHYRYLDLFYLTGGYLTGGGNSPKVQTSCYLTG